MDFTILKYDSIGSTNIEAADRARRGAPEGTCIVAREQSAGRGRHGRSWISEKDAGLFFSIVLRPELKMRYLPLITLMTAVAVHDTLEVLFGFDCDVKWVNDIHIGGKKICGILAETCETPTGLAVIVGIGVNLRAAGIRPELSQVATSVEIESGEIVAPEQVFSPFLEIFNQYWKVLSGLAGPERIRFEWAQRSSYNNGKNVKVMLENETIIGITRGIEENGALRVETGGGEIRIISTGDVEQLRAS